MGGGGFRIGGGAGEVVGFDGAVYGDFIGEDGVGLGGAFLFEEAEEAFFGAVFEGEGLGCGFGRGEVGGGVFGGL